MAGLGFKQWVTDDVLSATDLNGYLADQAVMVFASAAARTAGITVPSEGMITYLSDSNTLAFYDGSSWVAFSVNAVAPTASNALKVSNQTVFIQAGTPTANASGDLWFW
jgi:hypothetical protein